jgi:hypothetical protein
LNPPNYPPRYTTVTVHCAKKVNRAACSGRLVKMVTVGRCDVKLCSCVPVFKDEKVTLKPVHMVEWRYRSSQSYLRH